MGWTFEDFSDYAGTPYFGSVTSDGKEMGINEESTSAKALSLYVLYYNSTIDTISAISALRESRDNCNFNVLFGLI